MKLSEMTDQEREALGVLVRLMVGADGVLSAEESSDLQQAAHDLGEEEFWTLVRETHGVAYAHEDVQALARNVERREVQEQIYGVLFSIASEGVLTETEDRILSWLAETWGLDVGTP